jgi:hypothetical protein
MDAEFIDPDQPLPPPPQGGRPPLFGNSPMSQMFPQNNYKEVIQEYTNEDKSVDAVRDKFWGVNSKSLVLGFNTKNDALDYQDIQEMSRLWDIMKDPEEDFTWDKGQEYHQITFLLKARTNRSILQPNGGMNERMAQNTQINQNIQSSTLKQGALGGGGFVNNAKDVVNKMMNN